MKIISVTPFKKGVLKNDLTYFSNLEISVGDIVSVPIKNKKTLALVTEVGELKKSKGNIKNMNFNLRKVLENKGSSIFKKEFMDAVFDVGRYFVQNKNRVMASLIPSIFIEEYDRIKKISAKDETAPDGKNEKNIRAEKLLFQYPFQDRISIYKTLIRESFARGKSVFIVIPTQSDIEKFTDQLSKGIEQFIFSLHSGANAKKNLAAYENIMNSVHPVLIIGTPPFLSIPKNNIGAIILEHENSNSYKMIKMNIDLRIFTEIYASKIKAKFILADEILRYETIGRIDIDNINPLYPLSFRIDFGGKIRIENPNKVAEALLPQSGNKASAKKFKIFSDQTIEEIRLALENKKKVFIFALRKGLATMTLCWDCNQIISCEKCETPLTLYSSLQNKKRVFVCNRCKQEKDADTVCKSCGSWNLMPLGIGTDTAYEELKKIFPKIKILKLDKESAKTASSAKKIAEEFAALSEEGKILIGTEMALFYLKEKAALSVIASFDSLWRIPDFKMGEKIIQIALSIINNTQEKLIIQTKNENDPAILAIKRENLFPFAQEELEDRRKLSYPPYKRFIKITHLGDKEETLKARKILMEIFKEYAPEIFSGFVTRLKPARLHDNSRAGGEKYITKALIKIDLKKWSLPEISAGSSIDQNLFGLLASLPETYEVSVDPENLL